MKRVLWVFFVVISGCLIHEEKGKEDLLQSHIIVDRDIRPYFNRIVKDIRREGVKINLNQPISIKLVDIEDEGIIGRAIGMFDRSRVEIIIDRDFWYDFNEMERGWALLHEMGHDFWEIFHYGDGIMRPYHQEGETHKTYVEAFKEMMADLRRAQGAR